MVKRIEPTPKDLFHLEHLNKSRNFSDNYQPKDYKNRVVLKPWGHEYLIFENENVAVWFLHINKRHSTSMHCHPNKKTSLILLSGEALCSTFGRRNILNGLEAIILEKTVFHSTQALSQGGIDLIEIETPPNKTDLVRLNDEYGRQDQGYEGLKEMRTTNLSEYNYFYFETPQNGEVLKHKSTSYQISLKRQIKNGERLPKLQDDTFHTSFKGQLSNAKGEVILDVGEPIQGKTLNNIPEIQVKNEIVLFEIKSEFQE